MGSQPNVTIPIIILDEAENKFFNDRLSSQVQQNQRKNL